MTSRGLWTWGTLLAMTAVAFGAFGAHVLRERLSPEMLNVFEIGARYQMYHALALLAAAWAVSQWPNRFIRAAGWLFLAGIVFFSGSLYLLALTGAGWWGAVAPIGGAAFLSGWACLGLGAWHG
jgi:uncharacterized membrane protein YgdD (TMEM256/DUF423 family)